MTKDICDRSSISIILVQTAGRFAPGVCETLVRWLANWAAFPDSLLRLVRLFRLGLLEFLFLLGFQEVEVRFHFR